MPENVNVYLDVSLRRFETVYPACGSPNSAIALTLPELEQYSGFSAWVDVCRGLGRAGGGITENRLFGGAQFKKVPLTFFAAFRIAK